MFPPINQKNFTTVHTRVSSPPKHQTEWSSDEETSNFSETNKKMQSSNLNIEGYRILSVLQEALRKMEIVESVPLYPDSALARVLGAEIFENLTEFRNCEIKYQSVYDKYLQKFKEETESDPNSEISAKNLRYISQMPDFLKDEVRKLKAATRSACRSLISIHDILAKIENYDSLLDENMHEYIVLWKDLIYVVKEKLQTTIDEDKKIQEHLSHILAKERKTNEEIATLREELEVAKKSRITEIGIKNENIKRLKEQLQDIKVKSEATASKQESKFKQREAMDQTAFKEKEGKLKPEIADLTKKLFEVQAKNQDEETMLRKKKFKMETEVENWIHKYDQEMEEKQNEIEETSAMYREEKAQLQELEQRFADIKKEYDFIVEQQRIAEEAEKKKQEDEKIMISAAIKIQALWRGHIERKKQKKAKSKQPKSGKKSASAKKKK
ncbi:hypothetical protein O9G_002214 [Rozella allomycis CSF55]|uniref:Dynein regulatory complex protein 10 n=1 Tax=Rozella allomycis (strain CSF55) TaxID=988480 RepID=A0A075AUZ3_ROZAC|nr:hypothetical protein O9G_002214 [Rozella allomycis CSF55]|eukprot:EPZ32374.1 hypothetical protein O9G_002214 [Rozella allomycis CSF55]